MRTGTRSSFELGMAASSSASSQEIINCSIPVWYDNFKAITFESVFIPLPSDFVTYLKADGIILPRGCSLSSHKEEAGQLNDDDNETHWSDSDSDPTEDREPYFPAVVEEIEAAIATLGGRVVPKLNWSTPRDASWLLPGNTIQCTTAGEVILLLKGSDFVAHDLMHVFDNCSSSPTHSYTLCLRKWVEFPPSTGFRCFVHNSTLMAISQRECTTCYSYLVSHQSDIRRDVVRFFQRNILNKFPEPNYVFDVCRINEGDIRLVDFNPFSSTTDSLLFTWDELSSGSISSNGDTPVIKPVIKVIESAPTIQPHDLQESRLPQDFVDLAQGEDIHKFIDFLRLNNLNEDSDSD